MQKKRTISLLLAIMMLFSLLPTSAFAAEGDSIVIPNAEDHNINDLCYSECDRV